MLAERGIALEPLLADARVNADGAQVTAPIERVQRLLELAAERLGSSLFGLDLAERISQGAYGVTEFVVRTAPTVRQALNAMCELSPLINPGLDMRYIADDLGCEVRFRYADRRDVLGEILNEYTIAYLVRQFAVVLGGSLPLARAWFAHQRGQGREEVGRRLGCTVGFGTSDCGFAVEMDVIDQAIPHSNEALHAFLLAQGRTQLANAGKHDVVSQITRAIEARVADPTLSAATIATVLDTSLRSLQRQLADAGTSYRKVIAAIRRRRRDELSRAGLGDAEIATRLGFANAKTMRQSLEDDDTAPS
jgi:AraC-like DNA-binding protein